MPPRRANRSGVGSKRPIGPVSSVDAPKRKHSVAECRRTAKQLLKAFGTKSPFVALYRYLTEEQSGGDVWVALELARMCGIAKTATESDGPMHFGDRSINGARTLDEEGTTITEHAGPNPITMAIFANRFDLAELITKEKEFRPELLDAVVDADHISNLHLCVKTSNIDGIKFLATHGADLDIIDRGTRASPLLFAVGLGRAKLVELLITLGASVKTYDDMLCPYLHGASLLGLCDVIEVLLDADSKTGSVDINENHRKNNTALRCAANHPAAANLLLSRGANVSVNDATLYRRSSVAKLNTPVAHRLDLGAAVDTMDDHLVSPLHIACEFEDEASALALLENGALVGEGILSTAARHGWTHTLRIIAKRYPNDLGSASVRMEWTRALFAALRLEDETLSEPALILIENGADVNAACRGKYPLQVAIMDWEVNVVKALLAKGADISVIYDCGDNAMQMAIILDKVDIVRAIVEARGYRALEAESSNPLWLEAARRDRTEMFTVLVQLELSGAIDKKSFLSRSYPCSESFSGSDVNDYANRDRANVSGTVLHFAAFLNDVETIELLIDHGADADVRSEYDGTCPLHVAASNNATACVKILVAKGADISAEDMYGYTPLEVAFERTKQLGTPLEALLRCGATLR